MNEHKIFEINTVGTKEYFKTGQMTSISKKSDENTRREQGTSDISNKATENSTKDLCFNNIAQRSEEKTVMLQRTSITNQTKEEKLTMEQGASILENPTKDLKRMLVGNIPLAHENSKNNVTSFNLTPLIVNTTRLSTQACVPDIDQHSSPVTCKKTILEESFHDVTDKSCSSQKGKPTTLSHALLQMERNVPFPARDRSPGSNSPADADYQRSLGETNSGSETGLFASSDDSIDSVIYRGTDRQPVVDACETLPETITNSTNEIDMKNLEISDNTQEMGYTASLERDFDLLDAELNKRNNDSQENIPFKEDFSKSANTGNTKLLPDIGSGQHAAHQITPTDRFLVTHTVETFLNRNLCMELDDSSDARTPLQRVDKHASGDRGLQSDRWIRRIVTTRDRVADDDDDVEGTYSVELLHQEAEPESSEPSSPEVDKQNDGHPIVRYEYKHLHLTRINFFLPEIILSLPLTYTYELSTVYKDRLVAERLT